jgi:hypothetical protein
LSFICFAGKEVGQEPLAHFSDGTKPADQKIVYAGLFGTITLSILFLYLINRGESWFRK